MTDEELARVGYGAIWRGLASAEDVDEFWNHKGPGGRDFWVRIACAIREAVLKDARDHILIHHGEVCAYFDFAPPGDCVE